ncbi:NinE family protein [Escherichia coli]|nr:NinE family protein [Escherichia coli]GCH61907.1 putative phage protein [Escherichia coli]
MATPLIRVMNGHIYKVPNRRKRKPELKPSEIPTLLGYTATSEKAEHVSPACSALIMTLNL